MRILVLSFLLVLISLAGSALYLAVAPANAPGRARIAREADEIPETVPDPHVRRAIRSQAARWTRFAARLPTTRGSAAQAGAEAALAAAAVRAVLALAVAPLFAAATALGVLAGFLRRNRLREEYGYASTTYSSLAKHGAALSIALYVFTGLSPLGPPVWTLYAWSGTTMLGATVYFGNLPPKI